MNNSCKGFTSSRKETALIDESATARKISLLPEKSRLKPRHMPDKSLANDRKKAAKTIATANFEMELYLLPYTSGMNSIIPHTQIRA